MKEPIVFTPIIRPLGRFFIRFYADSNGKVHIDVIKDRDYVREDNILWCETLQ